MQISPCHPLWPHLRPLTLALLMVVCGRFGSGEEATGYELKIRPQQSSFIKTHGSSVVLACQISGANMDSATSYDLRWFHNSSEITDKASSRVYVEDGGTAVLKLYITGFEKQDEGVYKCAGTIDGTLLEKSTNIFLYQDITFDHAPGVQHPAIYTDAVIECLVSGRPMPTVSWRYKEKLIRTDGRYMIVAEGLRIRNVTKEDDGIYRCRAEIESDGRYNEKRITVAVHIPPKILGAYLTANATEGGEISVFCRAEGLPAPEFQFYKIKEGVTVAVEATDRLQIDAKAGTLAFRPFKKEDEGKYLCRAHNDVGNDMKEVNVEVLVKPAIYDFQNVTSNEGDTPTIFCSAHGYPAPTMTFRKAGNTVNYVVGHNEESRLTVSRPESGRLSLKFNSLIPSDSGEYICRVESDIGSDEQSARLTVKYRPRFVADHTRLVRIRAGETRNMSCIAEGEPVPTIEWLRGNVLITNNSTYTIFNSDRTSNLQVTVLEENQTRMFGNYTCRASNELGTVTYDIKIELRRAYISNSRSNSFSVVNYDTVTCGEVNSLYGVWKCLLYSFKAHLPILFKAFLPCLFIRQR